MEESGTHGGGGVGVGVGVRDYKPAVQLLAAVQSATGSSSEQTIIIRGTAAASLRAPVGQTFENTTHTEPKILKRKATSLNHGYLPTALT